MILLRLLLACVLESFQRIPIFTAAYHIISGISHPAHRPALSYLRGGGDLQLATLVHWAYFLTEDLAN